MRDRKRLARDARGGRDISQPASPFPPLRPLARQDTVRKGCPTPWPASARAWRARRDPDPPRGQMGGFATSAEIRRGSDQHRGDRTVVCRLGDARVVGCVTARSQARLGVCKPDVAWIFLGGTPWQGQIAPQLGQEAVQDDEGTLECREAWNWSCEWCRPGFVEGIGGRQ